MQPLRFQGHWLVLSACGAALSCATLLSSTSPLPPARAATPASQTSDALEKLEGTRAAGSQKDSPFAAAQDSDAATRAHLRVHRDRLWWLLLPVGLAAVSYQVLRAREGAQG